MSAAGGWVLKIGDLFAPGVTSWPERFEYRVFGQGQQHMLQICASKLDDKQLQAFHRGQMHVGLYLSRGVAFFLFRIEGFFDWSDQAIHMQLVHPEDRGLPDESPGYQVVSIVLVECETGIVRGIRVVTLSPHFTRLFAKALRAQMTATFDLATHQAIIADVYKRFPHSRQLVKAALVVEKAGAKL